jgi:hypothetical protein
MNTGGGAARKRVHVSKRRTLHAFKLRDAHLWPPRLAPHPMLQIGRQADERAAVFEATHRQPASQHGS